MPTEDRKSTRRRRYASPFGKLETPNQIQSAWAYIHQQANADLHTEEEVRTIKIRVRRAAEALGVNLPNPKRSSARD